jgi:uncharacterized linocin/CFP29 family protein
MVMNSNNLGRDKVWNESIWSENDKAVMIQVGQIRIGQKVFPTVQLPASQVVPADQLDLTSRGLVEGRTKPFIELSIDFPLTHNQVESEETERSGSKLSSFWARALVLAEDALLFQGKEATLPTGVNATNKDSAELGLLGKAASVIPVDIDPKKGYPESVFGAVADGIAKLVDAGHPGPYALILESSIYADTYRPQQVAGAGTLVTVADRISALVPGGFYSTGTLLVRPPVDIAVAAGSKALKTGLLASIGGHPTTIYVGGEATTAFTQSDTGGNLRFRVFERMQFTALDGAAFVRLEFK